MGHQLPVHGIFVHVGEFFPKLLFTPDVEVVKAALPERRRFLEPRGKGKPELLGRRCSVPAQRTRYLLLQNLQDLGRIPFRRFADEQVHVLGHDHISDQSKRMSRANFMQNPYKAIASANGSEVGTPPVTTEGNEMQVAASVESFQGMADDFHGKKEKSKSAP